MPLYGLSSADLAAVGVGVGCGSAGDGLEGPLQAVSTSAVMTAAIAPLIAVVTIEPRIFAAGNSQPRPEATRASASAASSSCSDVVERPNVNLTAVCATSRS